LLQIFHDPGARRANFAFLSPKIQFFKSQDLGAAPMRLGTVLSAKKARVRRGDCAIYFRQKMRKFICKFSVRPRATHQSFGRRRFENFLTSQKCCIESMGRAVPKTRASGAEFA